MDPNREQTNRAILIVVLVSNFLVPFTGTALNVAVPMIGSEFHVTATTLTWIVSAYMMSTVALSVPFGRIADIRGKRPIFLLGVAIFAVTSFLVTFSHGMTLFIVFRVVMGAGAAMIFATNMPILVSAWPAEKRGRVLGLYVMTVYVGLACGPVLGGLLTDAFGWRSIQYLIALISVAVIVLALLKLPKEAGGAPVGSAAGIDHTNIGHAGVDHTRVSPADVDHAGVDHTRVSPADIGHAGVDHPSASPADSDHAGIDHTGIGYADVDPRGIDPTDIGHAGVDHTSVGHADVGHRGIDHTGIGYADVAPRGINPTDIGHAGVDHPRVGHSGVGHRGIDPVSILLFICATLVFLYGFTSFGQSILSYICLAGGFVLLLIYLRYEGRSKAPVFNVNIFRHNAVFLRANLAALLNYAATYAVGYIFAIYLQIVKGYPANIAGVILITQPVVMAVVAPLAGRLSDRRSPFMLAAIGMAFTAVALFSFVFIGVDTPLWRLIAGLLVVGFGFGMFSSPNTNALMSSVEPRDFGVASSVQSTARTMGQVIGMALITIVTHFIIGAKELADVPKALYTHNLNIAFIIFAALCAAGVFISLNRKSG